MAHIVRLNTFSAVFVVQTLPNYAQPWQMRPQRSSAGSAFILDIERKEIMTNAHVVHPFLHSSNWLTNLHQGLQVPNHTQHSIMKPFLCQVERQ